MIEKKVKQKFPVTVAVTEEKIDDLITKGLIMGVKPTRFSPDPVPRPKGRNVKTKTEQTKKRKR